MFTKFWLYLKIVAILSILYFLCGCGTRLFTKEQLNRIDIPESEDHIIAFYSQHYLNTAGGNLFSTTHKLIQIGANTRTVLDNFIVIDGSIRQLKDFEARLIKSNGTEITYSLDDLNTIKISNSYMISELDVKILPISELIEVGDLLEMVSVHEHTIPALGINFSLPVIGDYGNNIECKIEIQKDDTLNYKIINSNISPDISENNETKIYNFKWQKYSSKNERSEFSNKNFEPEILATVPKNYDSITKLNKPINTWIDFGNWYFELIKSKLELNDEILNFVNKLVRDSKTPKEKMDAIFQYCQKNVRYEQVYLAFGEFIPNNCNDIFNRKYGDCKDYAALIYTMAKSVGLDPNIALCYRGRGVRFFKEIPVNQFNHVIIHFEDNGVHYWYDGTNRTGIPGITTSDLINQPAFIIEKNNSRFISIEENQSNLLMISGELKRNKTNLTGKLHISLVYQYSILFFYLDSYFNNIKMQNFLIEWVKSNLNSNLIIRRLSWQADAYNFNIYVDCEFPNSVTELNNNYYLSFNRCFPDLLIEEDIPADLNKLFYYNRYNRVRLILNFENIKSMQENNNKIELDYTLPPGPFENNEKKSFINKYSNLLKKFNKKYSFRKDI